MPRATILHEDAMGKMTIHFHYFGPTRLAVVTISPM